MGGERGGSRPPCTDTVSLCCLEHVDGLCLLRPAPARGRYPGRGSTTTHTLPDAQCPLVGTLESSRPILDCWETSGGHGALSCQTRPQAPSAPSPGCAPCFLLAAPAHPPAAGHALTSQPRCPTGEGRLQATAEPGKEGGESPRTKAVGAAGSLAGGSHSRARPEGWADTDQLWCPGMAPDYPKAAGRRSQEQCPLPRKPTEWLP